MSSLPPEKASVSRVAKRGPISTPWTPSREGVYPLPGGGIPPPGRGFRGAVWGQVWSSPPSPGGGRVPGWYPGVLLGRAGDWWWALSIGHPTLGSGLGSGWGFPPPGLGVPPQPWGPGWGSPQPGPQPWGARFGVPPPGVGPGWGTPPTLGGVPPTRGTRVGYPGRVWGGVPLPWG